MLCPAAVERKKMSRFSSISNKRRVLRTRVRAGMKAGFRTLGQPEVAVWAVLQGAAVAAAVVTAMLLGGCASFSGIAPSAKIVSHESLATEKTFAPLAAEDKWPNAQWWKRFGDAQLDALIDEALASDGAITLRVAEARLKSASALASAATSRALPRVNLDGNSTRERFSENYIYPPPLGGSTLTVNQLALDFSYDIDFWGRNQAAIDAARSQARVVAADGQAARLALTTSIARAWFQLQRLYALRDVTLAATRQRQDILDLTRQRFNAGLDTNAELRQAEAGLPIARVDLAQIDESIALVHNQIAALLGKGPDRGITIGLPNGHPEARIALPALLPAELIGRRPDLVAARWRVEAARRDIDNAKARFYPNINLVASAGFLALGASRFLDVGSRNLTVGPAISLPIFDGGSLRANLSGKDADYDAAVEQYNQTLVDALKDVADQVVSLRSVTTQLADQDLARVKTEQAYDVAMTRYKAGLATYLTVLTAQTAVLQQQRADTELKARVVDLDVGLIRALGGGYEAHDDDAPPIAQRDPS